MNKLISKMKVQNQDLVAKGRQAYKDIKQSQIVHEKDKYELFLQLKEQGHMLKTVKKDLEEKDTQLMQLKHQEAVLLSQKQLAESGQGSFITSASQGIATPSPEKSKRPIIGNEDPIEEKDTKKEGLAQIEQKSGGSINELEDFDNFNNQFQGDDIIK